MPAYLHTILAAHRAAAEADPRERGAAIASAMAATTTLEDGTAREGPRAFAAALRTAAEHRGIAMISEIKRRSPSRGDLAPDLDPALVAADYEAGGAACLSVLTDQEIFGGSPADLSAARSACGLPVLRKDFTVDALDVCDARAMGADAVLLIVAALDDAELASLLELARSLRLDALVEVHDDAELDRALAAGADLIGVNQRDLRTFEVDHERALRLASRLPEPIVSVAESGIRDAADVRRLADAGFDAVLVGETLVGASDREAAVSNLLGALG